MVYSNPLFRYLKLEVLHSSRRMCSIKLLVLFIMLVYITTFLSVPVESSSTTTDSEVRVVQDGLQEQTRTLNSNLSEYRSAAIKTSSSTLNLPFINNSSGDDSSKLNNSELENMMLTHNEPDLDSQDDIASKTTNISMPNLIRSQLSMTKSDEVNTITIPANTTQSPIENIDELNNKYYLQNSLDEATTLPSLIDFTTPKINKDRAANQGSIEDTFSTVSPNEVNQSTLTTKPIPLEILQASETKPTPYMPVNLNSIVPTTYPLSVTNTGQSSSSSFDANWLTNLPKLSPTPEHLPILPYDEHQQVIHSPNSIPSPIVILPSGGGIPEIIHQKPLEPQRQSLANLLYLMQRNLPLNLTSSLPSLNIKQHFPPINMVNFRVDSKKFNAQQMVPNLEQVLSKLPQVSWRSNDQLRRSNVSPHDQSSSVDLFPAGTTSYHQSIKKDLSILDGKSSVSSGGPLSPLSNSKSKYSLISPYSANFDSGITNFPINKLKLNNDPVLLDQTSKAKLNSLLQKHEIYDKLKQYHESRLPQHQEQASASAGYAKEVGSKLDHQSTTKPVLSISKQSNKKEESSFGNKPVESAKTTNTVKPPNEMSSKRGERNAEEKSKIRIDSRRPSKSQPQEEITDSKGANRVNYSSSNRHSSAVRNKNPENERSKSTANNPSMSSVKVSLPNIQNYTNELSSFHDGTRGEDNDERVPYFELSQSNNDSHYFSDHPALINYHGDLNDHKKSSFYRQPENIGLGIDELPQPLTIGELAHQHGVPFRLRSPLGENYYYGSPTGFDNEPKLSMESNQYDDYVYMPYRGNNNKASYGLPGGGGGVEFDDELKKKLAMKTIEAITKDPEFSTTLFDNLYNLKQPHNSPAVSQATNVMDNQHQTSSTWQKLVSSLISANTGSLTPPNYPSHSPHIQAASTNSLATSNMLPMATVLDQLSLVNNPSSSSSYSYNHPNYIHDQRSHYKQQSGPKLINSSKSINLMEQQSDVPYKWALSRMPDLIPIPLAATVPGYLIRLSNGQILAAALTNSFSIQGIQKGPLGSSYKNFLNQRLKSLIKPGAQNQHGTTGINHVGADSAVHSVSVPATSHHQLLTPSSNHHQSPSKISEKASGLFSRMVLGFSRPSQRSNSTRELDSNKVRKTFSNNSKFKIVHLTSSPHPVPAFSDHELAALPIASLNEPVFSFADESQLLDSNDNHQSPPIVAPIKPTMINEMIPDLIHSDSSLAMRAKLNQFMSLRNLFSEDTFNGGGVAKKRKSHINNWSGTNKKRWSSSKESIRKRWLPKICGET